MLYLYKRVCSSFSPRREEVISAFTALRTRNKMSDDKWKTRNTMLQTNKNKHRCLSFDLFISVFHLKQDVLDKLRKSRQSAMIVYFTVYWFILSQHFTISILMSRSGTFYIRTVLIARHNTDINLHKLTRASRIVPAGTSYQ